MPDSWSRVVEIQAFGTSAGGEKVQWLVPDHLGSPRIVLDQTGSLVNVKRHDYLPFGEELFAGTGGRTIAQGYSADGIRQQFTSKERDTETGLDYFLARYYSSTQGRFTSPDEFSGGPDDLFDFTEDAAENPTFYGDLSNPQSLNKYSYTYNNPLAFTDDDGHIPFLVVAVVVVAVAILSSPDTTNAPRPTDPVYPSGDGMKALVGNAALGPVRGAAARGGGAAVRGAARAPVRPQPQAPRAQFAASARKPVHGNSARSNKPQHGYEIFDKKGDVKKVGVSGQPRRKDGSSPRANTQVNRENRTRSPKNQVQSAVRKTAPNRKKILEWEAKQAERRRRQGHSMDMHKRP